MTTVYPSALDNPTNPTATDLLASLTVPHATQHANANDAIKAIEAKLGIGVGGSVLNSVLIGTGVGSSGWGFITNANVSGAAAISGSKIATQSIVGSYGGPGTGQILATSINGAQDIVASTIDNARIAPLAIRGGVDGGAGRIAVQSINGQDLALTRFILGGSSGASSHIAVNTIQGGAAGGNSNIAPGSLVTGDFAANAAGVAAAAIDGAAASTTAPGAFVYAGVNTGSAGMVPSRTKVLVIFTGSVQNNTVNAICQLGIGIDTTGGPTINATSTMAVANNVTQITTALIHTATLTGHTYYGLWYTNAGTMNRYGTISILVLAIQQ